MGCDNIAEEDKVLSDVEVFSADRKAEEEESEIKESKINKLRKLVTKKRIIVAGCCLAAVGAVFLLRGIVHKQKDDAGYDIVKAERRDIVRTIECSSVLEANDSYDVTSLVTGEITADTFSEGDIVRKDQLLYRIDSGEAERSVATARNALEKAQQAFEDAVRKKSNTLRSNDNTRKMTGNAVTKALENVEKAKRDLGMAQRDADDLNIVADNTGTVREVLLKAGDTVNDGTVIANIYDGSRMKIQLPFNESEVSGIYEGSVAEITMAASDDKLIGYVEGIAGSVTATSAHAVVRYVTVVVDNPGGLNAGEKATAVINGIACCDLGEFENYDESKITAKTAGRIKSIYIDRNDHVTAGQIVGSIESDNIADSLTNAQSGVKSSELDLDDAYTKLAQLVIDDDTYALDSSIASARIEVDNARLSLENANKKLEDYEVTAPIDGTIITKNKKVGDKLEQNTGGAAEPMAVIYDMSVLTVRLDIDESEISDVRVGQQVRITADAADGTFSGEVTKVGINGNSENGVTSYPVDVTIADYGQLLPGMNVDCVIEAERADNVVAIPVGALYRGDLVYMKGEKTEKKDKAPDGWHSVKVETGVSDHEFIEIKSGVKDGDELCGTVTPSGTEAEGSAGQQPSGMNGGMNGGGPRSGGMGGGPMR